MLFFDSQANPLSVPMSKALQHIARNSLATGINRRTDHDNIDRRMGSSDWTVRRCYIIIEHQRQ
jgi:hypothetical protein